MKTQPCWILIAVFVFIGADTDGVAQERQQEEHSWNDILKGIEIGPGVLDIGGNIRIRTELFNDFTIKGYGTGKNGVQIEDDGMLLERIRIDFNYRLFENLNFFVQFQDAHFWFSELDLDDFGDVCAYENPFDLKKAYIDWRKIGDTPFGFQFGRQAISYRDNRVWGPGDWGNTGRYTWDALKLYIETDWVDTDIILAQRVISHKSRFDDDYHDFDAYGLYSKVKQLPFDLDFFYILKADDETIPNVDKADRHSIGVYANGKLENSIDWSGMGAYQFGEQGNEDISAFGMNAKVGYTFNAPWKPRIGVEYSHASGDADPNDGETTTFDGLFGAVDTFYGRMNIFAWMNLQDYQATFSVKPTKTIDLSVDYHYFRRDEKNDFWYHINERPIRVANRANLDGLSSELGHEVDLLVKWRINKQVELFSGYSHFFAGGFIDDSANVGITDDADWVFLQFTYFF
jgi:hypothetical protein